MQNGNSSLLISNGTRHCNGKILVQGIEWKNIGTRHWNGKILVQYWHWYGNTNRSKIHD